MPSHIHFLIALATLIPVTAPAMQVSTQAPLVDATGQTLHIRGVTWPGFDRAGLAAVGMRNNTLAQLLDRMQASDINAVRVPVCAAVLQRAPVAAAEVAGDSTLRGLDSLQLLDAVVHAASQRGMQVMFAFADGGCDDRAPLLGAQQQAWTRGLVTLARRYGGNANVLGIDLGSSGYRNASWAGNAADQDWNRVASRAVARVLAQAPRWVVGVEGVGSNAVCSDPERKAPGSNLQPFACVPLEIARRHLVLMPKLAGPDRDTTDAFAAPGFAQALPAMWQRDFGQFAIDHAVVPVSLGGGLGDGDPRDPAWQTALSGYLANAGIRSAFLGSWETGNANNGGLLAPDGSPRADKLLILRHAWGRLPVMPAIATATGDSTKNASGKKPWNSTFTGTATVTGSGYSGGALLLDPIPSDAFITALNPVQLNFGGVKAALAGAYLQVNGPKGTTTVYVTDLYPEGASGGLDLSHNAFAAIGDMVQGRIPISWKVVRAPVTGNLQYRIKEGSSRWWAAIQVRNHAYPVVKLEVKQGSTWKNLQKMDYNHFLGEQLGNQPLTLRITDIRGKVLTDTLPRLPEDGSKPAYFEPGHVQFP
ncbi:expansin EXLX1 family cellulose-binding protein [Xanthomonas campestris]|uniref:expansin EXLX1 family cellulose-binding protein n=1 Tax=Xanthomonas campestris TaxID=339 RepID=UPI001EEE6866|nr:expansin EXLX1 family cellulose-binding protein [Xanthomonas campestris]MCF8795403.1 cellulase family glycosylhydrolase [Xanthomonas campestris pv. campestris]MCF8812274.1 cellulase family glycosylhydrolase [Xanthomonas campestris pv. campestris]WHO89668.1 expansin EXLX1 family cellulose-binding protein [Xanthomonas campestris]